MENEKNVFMEAKAMIVLIAGEFTAAFGYVGWLVLIWLISMVADYATGSWAAKANGEWSSAMARKGIFHKCGMIFVVGVAALVDSMLAVAVGNIPGIGVEYTTAILPVVLVWYIITERGSILENAVKMGAPVPSALKNALAIAKKSVESASKLAGSLTGSEEERKGEEEE